MRTEENLIAGHVVMWAPLDSVQVQEGDNLEKTLLLVRSVTQSA
ncbi:hypothetical protein [Streptomyces sp. NPDC020983]